MPKGTGGSTYLSIGDFDTQSFPDGIYFGTTTTNNDGYMGLGVVTPQYPLDINGSMNLTNSINIGGNKVIDGNSLGAVVTTASGLQSAPQLTSTGGLVMNGHSSANGNMNLGGDVFEFTINNTPVLSKTELKSTVTTAYIDYNDAQLYNNGGVTCIGDIATTENVFIDKSLFIDLNADITGNIIIGGTASITGDFTVDTDTFYADTTNNRIGIGTNNPQSILHINSSDSINHSVQFGDTSIGRSVLILKGTASGGSFVNRMKINSESGQDSKCLQIYNDGGIERVYVTNIGDLVVTGDYVNCNAVKLNSLGSAPSVTTDKLYNVGGVLYFNGSAV